MDWTAGYASDIEYTAGFYREQSPNFLNFVCVLNGFEPVPLEHGFSYFELGFGRGLTVNMLAAANPQGRFYAADFNPGHVAGARELAAAAGLDNLTLYEDSFAELAAGREADLPQFDFISLHGIYTWVTAENQRHIVDFIARYLKPGGIVYMSYNAMPGWSGTLPLQRLLVEYGDAYPGRSDAQIKGAVDLVRQMQDAGAMYFNANPSLTSRLDTLQKAKPNYLVHEYMHKHWEPLYHADVARHMSPAKLDFVGSADLAVNFSKLYMSPEKLALMGAMHSSAMRETMRDYLVNTGFRKDVFVRGARLMHPLRQAECLSAAGVALTVPRAEAQPDMKLSIGAVSGKVEIYDPLFDALAHGPRTLRQLKDVPALQAVSLNELAQAAALLAAAGQAEVFFASTTIAPPARALSMNAAIAGLSRFGDDYQALCSPVTGSGLGSGFVERLVYHVLASGANSSDINTVAGAVWEAVRAQGQLMVRDGVALQSPQENLAEVRIQAARILDSKLPIWRQMGMIAQGE